MFTILAAVVWVYKNPARTDRDAASGATLSIKSVGTADAVAFDRYQRGRYYFARRGTENLLRALEEFRRAVARDSGFARAHAGVSAAATLLTLYNGTVFARDSMLSLALAEAKRAVALNDSLAEGYAALGQALTYLGRRAEAGIAYQRAVALDPGSATAHQWFAELLITDGRVDEAVAEMELALRAEPLSAINQAVAANHYRLAGRFDEALQHGERAVELDPTMPAVWEFYARALYFAGKRDSAERLFARHSPTHPFHAYIRARKDRAVRDSLRSVVERWDHGATPVDGTVSLALISLAAENLDAALDVLARARTSDPAFPLHNTLADQVYDPIRTSAAFRDIVRSAGLDEQLNLHPRRRLSVAVVR